MLVGIGQPKIHQFDPPIEINQQVLRLEIPMNNTQLMQVLNSSNNLLKILTSLSFPQSLHPNNLIKKFALRYILHNQKQLFGCFDNLVELDDVGVSDLLQNVYLAGHSLHVRDIRDLALFEDFYCYFLLGLVMDAQLHFAECALSEIFACIFNFILYL